jgi:hypothetical protein
MNRSPYSQADACGKTSLVATLRPCLWSWIARPDSKYGYLQQVPPQGVVIVTIAVIDVVLFKSTMQEQQEAMASVTLLSITTRISLMAAIAAQALVNQMVLIPSRVRRSITTFLLESHV